MPHHVASARSFAIATRTVIEQATAWTVTWAKSVRGDAGYWLLTISVVLAVVASLVRGNFRDGGTLFVFAALLVTFGVSTLWHAGNVYIRSLAGDDRHLFRAKLRERAGKLNLAIEELGRHERRFPGNLQAIKKRATLQMRAGRHQEALDEIEKALVPFPQPELVLVRALLSLQCGALEAALRDGLSALEQGNGCGARQIVGTSLIMLRRLEKVLAVTEEAPADHRICMMHHRGEALRLLGRADEATECFRLVAESGDAKVGMSDRIDALGHLGRHAEAEALLTKGAKSIGSFSRAVALFRRGDPESMSAAIPALLERGPFQAVSIIGDPEFSHLLTRSEVREKFAGVIRTVWA